MDIDKSSVLTAKKEFLKLANSIVVIRKHSVKKNLKELLRKKRLKWGFAGLSDSKVE